MWRCPEGTWAGLVLALCWSGGLFGQSAPGGAVALPDGAAASVNGAPIPQRLVDIFLKNDQEALRLDFNPATPEGRVRLSRTQRAIIEELIDRALIAQGAAALGVAPAPAAIDAAEQRMIDYCGDLPRFQAFLAQNGFDRQTYREAVLGSAANGEAMQQALSRKMTPVTDEEIKTYYEAHRTESEFQWPERAGALHILFNAQPGVLTSKLQLENPSLAGTELQKAVDAETERRRLLAEEIRRRASAPGADFEALAREHSDDLGTRKTGGNLGIFARGAHSAALDEAIFKLTPGAVGPVVKTDFGFHVVKVTERRAAGPRPLEDAAPLIRQRLTQSHLAKAMRDWLAESRAKAAIVIRPEEVAAVTK